MELKHEDCAKVGIESVHEHLAAGTTAEELFAAVRRLNANPAVDAFLVQVPLPGDIDEFATLLAVDPEKDVDGLHPVNLGRLVMGVDGTAALHAGRDRRAPPVTTTFPSRVATSWSSVAG